MNKDKLNLIENYIKIGVSPILIQNENLELFEDSVIINSNIEVSQLNGHYENTEFCPPKWYESLLEKSKLGPSILVIKDINLIPNEEQVKFKEILKYRKISTFQLPENCLIVVTYSSLENNKINEEVYSLLVQI